MPYLNGDNAPSVGMQMTDRPEHGAQEHRLRHTGGMGGQDGAGEQEYIEGEVRDRGGRGG